MDPDSAAFKVIAKCFAQLVTMFYVHSLHTTQKPAALHENTLLPLDDTLVCNMC